MPESRSRRGPKPKSAPDPLCAAARQFREALGMTQQQFALRLNAAIRTVARYETVRPPSPGVLVKLAEIARDASLYGFAEAFEAAIEAEMPMGIRRIRETIELRSGNEPFNEKTLVSALIEALRNDKYAPLRNDIVATILPVMIDQATTVVNTLHQWYEFYEKLPPKAEADAFKGAWSDEYTRKHVDTRESSK